MVRKYSYAQRVRLVGETRARYISDEGVEKILAQRAAMRERSEKLRARFPNGLQDVYNRRGESNAEETG